MVAQNTVVLGAVAGAAAVAAGYEFYKKSQLEKAKQEAERKEDEIQAERLQRLQEKLASSKRGKGDTKGWPSELVSSCRIHTFEGKLSELFDVLQNDYAARAAHPIQRLPLLGSLETPSAAVLAVLYLWGDPMLYTYFVFQNPDFINKEELLSSGFALSQLSERSARHIEEWLAKVEGIELVNPSWSKEGNQICSELHRMPNSLLQWVGSLSMNPSLMCFVLDGNDANMARRAWSTLSLLCDMLGLELHDCKTEGPMWTVCVGANGPNPLIRWTAKSPAKKGAAKRSGVRTSESVLIANFNMRRGFDMRLVVKDGRWFTSSEVLSSHPLTSSQDRGIDFYTRRLLSLEAGVLRRRVAGGRLAGGSFEHCQAWSGSVKLFGCERGSVSELGRLASRPSPDLLPTLRHADVEHLVESFEEVADTLREELRGAVPAAAAAAAAHNRGSAAGGGAAATASGEVDELVAGLVQLLEMSYFVTPRNQEGREAASCREKTSIAAEAATAAGLDAWDDGNSEALGYQLTRLSQRREDEAALHVRAPVWFIQAVTALAVFLLSLTQLVCWYNLLGYSVALGVPYPGLVSLVLATAMSAYPAVLLLRFYRAVRAGRPSRWLSAVFQTMLRLGGMARRGWKQMLTGKRLMEQEVTRVKGRCKEILRGWSHRLAEAFICAAVRDQEVDSGRVILLMEELLSIDGPNGAIPGPVDIVLRFLSLEVISPAQAGRGAGAARQQGPMLLGDLLQNSLSGTRLQARRLGCASGWESGGGRGGGISGVFMGQGGQMVFEVVGPSMVCGEAVCVRSTGEPGLLLARCSDGSWQVLLRNKGQCRRMFESELETASGVKLLGGPDTCRAAHGAARGASSHNGQQSTNGGGGGGGGGGAAKALTVRGLLRAAGWAVEARGGKVVYRYTDPAEAHAGR